MLINFTAKDVDEAPQWQGYFYAVVMLVAAQLQSLILAQYFKKMYLVGLQVRSGIISAVYGKVRYSFQFVTD